MYFVIFFWKIQIPRRRVDLNPSSSLLASQDETKLPKGDYRSSFCACFMSIFQIHTETGNMWIHLPGFVLSLCLGIPDHAAQCVLHGFFAGGGVWDALPGAVLCLSYSILYLAIPYCLLSLGECLVDIFNFGLFRNCTAGHGELCYLFYCSSQPRLICLYITCILGISAITEPQPIWDCSCSGAWVHLVGNQGERDTGCVPQRDLIFDLGQSVMLNCVPNVGCGLTPPPYSVNTMDIEDGLLQMHWS